MKKFLLLGIIILAILSIEFYVGFVLGKNSQTVTVKIKNQSSHQITFATVEFYEGSRVVYDIKKGDMKLARFYAGGKSIYHLEVVLDNNTKLFSASRFVAPGCLLIERVTDSLIVSER